MQGVFKLFVWSLKAPLASIIFACAVTWHWLNFQRKSVDFLPTFGKLGDCSSCFASLVWVVGETNCETMSPSSIHDWIVHDEVRLEISWNIKDKNVTRIMFGLFVPPLQALSRRPLSWKDGEAYLKSRNGLSGFETTHSRISAKDFLRCTRWWQWLWFHTHVFELCIEFWIMFSLI